MIPLRFLCKDTMLGLNSDSKIMSIAFNRILDDSKQFNKKADLDKESRKDGDKDKENE